MSAWICDVPDVPAWGGFKKLSGDAGLEGYEAREALGPGLGVMPRFSCTGAMAGRRFGAFDTVADNAPQLESRMNHL